MTAPHVDPAKCQCIDCLNAIVDGLPPIRDRSDGKTPIQRAIDMGFITEDDVKAVLDRRREERALSDTIKGRAARFCIEHSGAHDTTDIEDQLVEEFAKIRAETIAACADECERIAKERHEQHLAALLASIQFDRPEVKTLPEHYRDVQCEGTNAAEECADAIRVLGDKE